MIFKVQRISFHAQNLFSDWPYTSSYRSRQGTRGLCTSPSDKVQRNSRPIYSGKYSQNITIKTSVCIFLSMSQPAPQYLIKTINKYAHSLAALFFSKDKKTPLHLASESGRTDVCKVLLDLRADASVIDNVSCSTR